MTDHEHRYMYDRAGTQATAIGRARLALSDGDPGKAADILDDAVDELHRLHWDACVADGHDREAITRFLGPRDAVCSRSRPRERHPSPYDRPEAIEVQDAYVALQTARQRYGDATQALRAAGWTPVGINRWEPPADAPAAETAAEDSIRVDGFVYGETVADTIVYRAPDGLLHFPLPDTVLTRCGTPTRDLSGPITYPTDWAGVWCATCVKAAAKDAEETKAAPETEAAPPAAAGCGGVEKARESDG